MSSFVAPARKQLPAPPAPARAGASNSAAPGFCAQHQQDENSKNQSKDRGALAGEQEHQR